MEIEMQILSKKSQKILERLPAEESLNNSGSTRRQFTNGLV